MKSFRQYLTETLSQAALGPLYDTINRKAFDNELPRVKLRISSKLNRATGIAKAKMRNGVLIPDSLEIAVSDKFALDPDTLEMILAHEMIHIWFYILGDFKESHGMKFRAKASEVGRRLGKTIPLTHDSSGLQISRPPKDVAIALIINEKNNKIGIFYNYTSYLKNTRLLEAYIKELSERGLRTKVTHARIATGKSMLAHDFKLSNAGKVLDTRPSLYNLKDEEVSEIMKMKHKVIL